MLNRALLCVVMMAAACRSSETVPYEAIAREVNPTLRALQTAFYWALHGETDHDPDLLHARIYACHTADRLLERLRRVDLSKTAMKEDFSKWVALALDDREVTCPTGGDLEQQERCAATCVESFRGILRVATELRREAKAHGVEIAEMGGLGIE